MKFNVSKQYGHFVQIWEIEAASEEDAVAMAEIDGSLKYQTIYRDLLPRRDYVVNLSEGRPSISKSEYSEWLEEAISLGMKVVK
jgi:hypothetical protein